MAQTVHFTHRTYQRQSIDMKTIFIFLLGFATACIAIIAIQWQLKPQLERDILSMQSTCRAAYNTFDGALETACGDMIDNVEHYGFEVKNKDGKFWAEAL